MTGNTKTTTKAINGKSKRTQNMKKCIILRRAILLKNGLLINFQIHCKDCVYCVTVFFDMRLCDNEILIFSHLRL